MSFSETRDWACEVLTAARRCSGHNPQCRAVATLAQHLYAAPEKRPREFRNVIKQLARECHAGCATRDAAIGQVMDELLADFQAENDKRMQTLAAQKARIG